MRNRSYKISSVGVAILFATLAWSGWSVAVASAAVEVTFSSTPLFFDADVAPGDDAVRTLSVTNDTQNTEPISVTSQNVFDTGLASVMNLTIEAAGTEYYSGSFADFFTASRTSLGQLSPGASETWTFTASLPAGTGNAYQTTEFGFDLVLGWSDGTITDTPNGSGGDAVTSSSGGAGGGGMQFRLFNEEVASVSAPERRATLTWNTNLRGTTYLVCGEAESGPFTLDPDADRFGYQFVVPEDPAPTVSHTAVLNDLLPGSYECRPASRPSTRVDFTVGLPLTFTIPAGDVAGVTVSEPVPSPAPLINANELQHTPSGSVLGAQKGTFGGPTYDEWKAQNEATRTASSTSDSADSDTEETTASPTEPTSPLSVATTATDAATDTPSADYRWAFGGLIVLFLGALGWYARRFFS